MKTLSPVVVTILTACSDNGFHTIADAQPRTAGIEVTPASIEFGAVTSDEKVAVQHITITSVGKSDLLIEDIEIGGKDAPTFTIVDGDTSFFLPAGASRELDVVFEPNGVLDAVGKVIVTSDDEVNPVLPVDLHGAAAIPQIAIQPDPIDFGAIEVGCDLSRSVDIVSVGGEPVTVSAIHPPGDGYTLSYGFSLPQTLQPGERLTVDLDFAPTDERDFVGTLEVVSDDYFGDRTGNQYGAGVFAAGHQDSWTLADRKADILFYVDHSGSMDDDAAALADNFAGFIADLSGYSSDWQIAVADNETGCNLGGILSPSASNYAARFTSAVTYTGTSTHDEEGLTVASLALDATDAGECNAGFLRPDALLHVVLVSDEREQSPLDWEWYVNQITAKKGDASLVRFSAVAGTPINDCNAEEGVRYADAVSATGGVFLSICSDWASSMDALADVTVYKDTFSLSHEAVPTTIEVTVDGQEVARGWQFDVATNSVVFDTPVAQGSTVDIDYEGYSDCQ
jgi:hypothetical protein